MESELRIAKEVSVRLHNELEQTEDKRYKLEDENFYLKEKVRALETRAKLNEASARFPVQAVYFITDLQRSTWSSASTTVQEVKADAEAKEKNAYLEIKKKATTIFVDVGPFKDPDN